MKRNIHTLSLAAIDDDGICAAQNPGSNADMTINGALASGGIATLDVARRVAIVSAGNDSSVTFTIYGTNRDGITINDTVTGANVGTVVSNKDFLTVTRIATSGDAANGIKVGTIGQASTPWIPCDRSKNPFNMSLGCHISSGGSMTYQVEHTLDSVQNLDNIKDAGTVRVLTHDVLVGKTTSDDGNYAFPVTACRLTLTAWTSGTISFITQQTG